jgi:hypothetical protein
LLKTQVAKLPEPLAQALLENVAATLAGMKLEELALWAGDVYGKVRYN